MTQNTQKSALPYQTLVAQITAAATEAGVPLRTWELKDWIGFESEVNKHKFYVPKNKGDVSWCHTTLHIPRVPGKLQDLPKGPGSIGKIETFVATDIEVIKETVLPLMTASENSLRENKRPTRAAASPATPAATPSTYVGSLDDVLSGE